MTGTERVTRLSVKKAVVKNPTVNIHPITIEDLLGILQEKSSVGGKSSGEKAESSKHQILQDKIEVLEEELCRKNQMIQNLQEEIQTLRTEGNNPAVNRTETMSEDSFSLEGNCGKEMDLNISIDKLLHCKAIAKRRAEELGDKTQLDKSNCSLTSGITDNTVLTDDDNFPVDAKEDSEEQSRTPKSAAKGPKERRPYRKKKVPVSSVRNMSAWLALAQKETVDKSVENEQPAKRKRSEEAAKDESSESPQPNILSPEENDSLGLKIKSFASQHSQELNVSLSEN